MKLTCVQMINDYNAIKDLSERKLPFRLSLLVSRNLVTLQKEYDFYMEQERKFAWEYLVIDKDTMQVVQSAPGIFKIQEGKEEECLKSRQELDNFEFEVEIRKLPALLLEPFDFTPAQLAAIDFMIEEEEEHE